MNSTTIPIISVVTVVLNDVRNIERTIQSVINQSYSNIEYIVIDGGSSDGTIEIINKYKENISIIISENDKGLYDAMNKGTKMATGEWIIYMNSGDRFYNTGVLSKIFIDNFENVNNKSLIYSNTISEFGNFQKALKVKSLNLFWTGFPACHQSQIVRTSIAKSRPFNLKYKVSADYDFCYYVYKNYGEFIYLKDITISICNSAEGVSKTTDCKLILIDNFMISKQYSNLFQVLLLLFVNISKYIYSFIVK